MSRRALFLGLAVTLSNLVALLPASLRAEGKGTIRVEIEQAGKVLPAQAGVVRLARAPFDIVLYLPDGGGLSLRAATEPTLYDLARQGAPLGTIFNSAQSMAEPLLNAERNVTLDDWTVQHYWYYESKDRRHRFNEVVPAGPLFKCRRTVERLSLFGDQEPLADSTTDALYLVFLAGEPAKDYATTIEKDRLALALTFSTPARRRATPLGNAAFDLALVQNGRPVPIKNGEASLRTEPFDVVVTLAARGGIYVHAAPDAAVYERARRGEPLASPFAVKHTMAIGFGNKGERLFIKDGENHEFWPYKGPEVHDFTSVERSALAVKCVRRISTLAEPSGARMAVQAWGQPLYLVFYSGDLANEDGSRRGSGERQRAFVKLVFPDGATQAPPPTLSQAELERLALVIRQLDREIVTLEQEFKAQASILSEPALAAKRREIERRRQQREMAAALLKGASPQAGGTAK